MRFSNYMTELSLAKKVRWYKVEDMKDRKTYEIHLPGDVYYVFDAYMAYVGNWLYSQFPDVDLDPMIWTIGFNDSEGHMEQRHKGASEALTLFAAIEQVFKDFLTRSWFEGFIRLASSNATYDIRKDISSIEIQTLLIAAQEDIITPYAQMREMSQVMPNSQFVCIPDTGHAAFLEKIDTVCNLVKGFLG